MTLQPPVCKHFTVESTSVTFTGYFYCEGRFDRKISYFHQNIDRETYSSDTSTGRRIDDTILLTGV